MTLCFCSVGHSTNGQVGPFDQEIFNNKIPFIPTGVVVEICFYSVGTDNFLCYFNRIVSLGLRTKEVRFSLLTLLRHTETSVCLDSDLRVETETIH